MDIQHLAKTDLNSLVTLYVVFEEGGVARAAERFHITPSPISKALDEKLADDLWKKTEEMLNRPLPL